MKDEERQIQVEPLLLFVPSQVVGASGKDGVAPPEIFHSGGQMEPLKRGCH